MVYDFYIIYVMEDVLLNLFKGIMNKVISGTLWSIMGAILIYVGFFLPERDTGRTDLIIVGIYGIIVFLSGVILLIVAYFQHKKKKEEEVYKAIPTTPYDLYIFPETDTYPLGSNRKGELLINLNLVYNKYFFCHMFALVFSIIGVYLLGEGLYCRDMMNKGILPHDNMDFFLFKYWQYFPHVAVVLLLLAIILYFLGRKYLHMHEKARLQYLNYGKYNRYPQKRFRPEKEFSED